MPDRGDIVILATKGAYTGKPRPWVVIQNNAFAALDSVTLCLLSTALIQGVPMLRVDIAPSRQNGLSNPSQVQIDKIVTVPVAKITRTIGQMEASYLRQVEDGVRFFLDLS